MPEPEIKAKIQFEIDKGDLASQVQDAMNQAMSGAGTAGAVQGGGGGGATGVVGAIASGNVIAGATLSAVEGLVARSKLLGQTIDNIFSMMEVLLLPVIMGFNLFVLPAMAWLVRGMKPSIEEQVAYMRRTKEAIEGVMDAISSGEIFSAVEIAWEFAADEVNRDLQKIEETFSGILGEEGLLRTWLEEITTWIGEQIAAITSLFGMLKKEEEETVAGYGGIPFMPEPGGGTITNIFQESPKSTAFTPKAFSTYYTGAGGGAKEVNINVNQEVDLGLVVDMIESTITTPGSTPMRGPY